jgi:hypothetical protein
MDREKFFNQAQELRTFLQQGSAKRMSAIIKEQQ